MLINPVNSFVASATNALELRNVCAHVLFRWPSLLVVALPYLQAAAM